MLLTFVILIALAAWLIFALRYLTRKDETGHHIHSCGGDCRHCAGCHLSNVPDQSNRIS